MVCTTCNFYLYNIWKEKEADIKLKTNYRFYLKLDLKFEKISNGLG